MHINFLIEVFQKFYNEEAIAVNGRAYYYFELLLRIELYRLFIRDHSIKKGDTVVLKADYSLDSVACLLSLIENENIIVPLLANPEFRENELLGIVSADCMIDLININENPKFRKFDSPYKNPLFIKLNEINHPGLVLFSSGSTGNTKAVVHDLIPMLKKFTVRKKKFKTIAFLLFDHIGGFNTLLYTLSNAGLLIALPDRSAEAVVDAIETYKAELLPTSPTFINLLLLSESYKERDLSSLKIITYGTEPMPESTLARLHILLPGIKLQQTYGSSEIGIMRSHSMSSDSLWVKLGGEGFETKVIDNILYVKADSTMLGYINEIAPIDKEGWFNTGDKVEQNGDYFRILGRVSELINVGGEKVYPTEVENCILELENVAEVTVLGEKNPITGNMIAAIIRLKNEEIDKKLFIKELKLYCSSKLASFKVPVKVYFDDGKQYSDRFKKLRRH